MEFINLIEEVILPVFPKRTNLGTKRTRPKLDPFLDTAIRMVEGVTSNKEWSLYTMKYIEFTTLLANKLNFVLKDCVEDRLDKSATLNVWEPILNQLNTYYCLGSSGYQEPHVQGDMQASIRTDEV